MATLPKTSGDFASQLKTLLEESDFDTALELIESRDVEVEVRRVGNYLEKLLLICRIADVLDYAGRYPEASKLIEIPGNQAKQRLRKFVDDNGFTPLADLDAKEHKQESWAAIHLGMSRYRDYDYHDALECFCLSKDGLDILARGPYKYCGSLSRAWYCIGLVHRQENRNREAKEAFTNSVEHGWQGIDGHQQKGGDFRGFDYNLAKNYALGLGWIAYNEASLAEAKSHLVTARRLLIESKARFINAYVDIVHACVLMSADLTKRTLDKAIDILQESYQTLTQGLKPDETTSNSAYAVRCANELAMASLRRALVSSESEKEKDLLSAKEWLDVVRTSKTGRKDKRTFCKALITESRIARARECKEQALALANEAFETGREIEFSLIDCYINRGEARCACNDYVQGISDFEQALSMGGSNPKVFGVCHLHLADAYFANGNRPGAQQYLKKWEESRPGRENAFIRKLADSVRAKLGEFQDFHKPTTLDLERSSYKDLVVEFRGWLTEVALHETNGNYKRAARRLDLSAGGFTKIRKAAGLPIHKKNRQ